VAPTTATTTQILDWLEGRLPAAQAATLEAAIESDPQLSRDAAWFRAFIELGEEIVLRSAPPHLAGLLASRFEHYRRTTRRSRLKVLVATLRLDSALRLGTAGVRSAGGHFGPRHLLYSTDVADIALDIHARVGEPALDVMGQLFRAPNVAAESFSVQLLRGDLEVGHSETDDLGEFSFEAITPGEYQFFVTSGALGILLTPVPVGL
jgi:hypothetical protein